MNTFTTIVLIFVFGFIIAGLQRMFSPETLANGFMDKDKGHEIAPTIFPKQNKIEEKIED